MARKYHRPVLMGFSYNESVREAFSLQILHEISTLTGIQAVRKKTDREHR